MLSLEISISVKTATSIIIKKVKQSCNTLMEAKRRLDYSFYSFTTSAQDGGEWSASRPGRALSPTERTPGTHWTGGWVGLRAGLDKGFEEKSLASAGDRTPIANP
jgi:hypothetical protein